MLLSDYNVKKESTSHVKLMPKDAEVAAESLDKEKTYELQDGNVVTGECSGHHSKEFEGIVGEKFREELVQLRAILECILHDLRVLEGAGSQQPSPWWQHAHALMLRRQLEVEADIEQLSCSVAEPR